MFISLHALHSLGIGEMCIYAYVHACEGEWLCKMLLMMKGLLNVKHKILHSPVPFFMTILSELA
jgi:hypothetical protein